jgi:hypothetical protein
MNDEVDIENEEQLVKSSPLNRSTKIMAVLVFVISTAGIVLYFAIGKGGFSDNALLKQPLALETTILSQVSGNLYSLPGDANIEPAYSLLSPSNQELLSSIPGLVTGQSELINKISILSTSIESLTRGLADFKAEMDTTLYAKFQALDQQSINSVEMQSQLTLLNNNFKAVEKSILSLKKQVAYKTKQISKSLKKKKSLPPFKLMSVQVWNSQPVAIVSSQNTKIGIGVNEVLAGWNIDSILMTGCMEVSQQNQSVKLCL